MAYSTLDIAYKGLRGWWNYVIRPGILASPYNTTVAFLAVGFAFDEIDQAQKAFIAKNRPVIANAATSFLTFLNNNLDPSKYKVIETSPGSNKLQIVSRDGSALPDGIKLFQKFLDIFELILNQNKSSITVVDIFKNKNDMEFVTALFSVIEDGLGGLQYFHQIFKDFYPESQLDEAITQEIISFIFALVFKGKVNALSDNLINLMSNKIALAQLPPETAQTLRNQTRSIIDNMTQGINRYDISALFSAGVQLYGSLDAIVELTHIVKKPLIDASNELARLETTVTQKLDKYTQSFGLKTATFDVIRTPLKAVVKAARDVDILRHEKSLSLVLSEHTPAEYNRLIALVDKHITSLTDRLSEEKDKRSLMSYNAFRRNDRKEIWEHKRDLLVYIKAHLETKVLTYDFASGRLVIEKKSENLDPDDLFSKLMQSSAIKDAGFFKHVRTSGTQEVIEEIQTALKSMQAIAQNENDALKDTYGIKEIPIKAQRFRSTSFGSPAT